MEIHVETACLWQGDNVERTAKAFRDASRVRSPTTEQSWRRRQDEAQTMYEDALTKAATLSAEDGVAMSTSVLYNLARVYEDESIQ